MALCRPLVMLATAAAAFVPYAVSAPFASASPIPGPALLRTVAYHGVSVQVPANWPVVDLDRDPSACVRLDTEAVYLGEPGEQQDCPAHAVGRADTVWLRDSGAAASMTAARSTRLGAMAARVQDQPLAQATQAELPARDVAVHSTYAAPTPASRGVVEAVLDSARTTAAKDTTAAPNPAFHAVPAKATTPPKEATAAATTASVRGSVATGMGFDTCAAPSLSTMRAWQSSPYRTLGIYLGGLMRACGDGNLSASWVREVTGMGFGLLPIYVGRQAPCFGSGARISTSPTTAAAQGRASAQDAVHQAKRFGLGTSTPIYYDMEFYSTASSSCSYAVTTFLSAWTAELRRLGYRSAAYGSPYSLVRDLAARAGTPGFNTPGDIWTAHWNYRQDTVTPYAPAGLWANHQRVHQYHGDHVERWGGVSINIDSNWVDGHVAGRARPASYGTNTTGPGGSHFVLTGTTTGWRANAGGGVKGMAYWTHPSSNANEYNGATWSPGLASGRYRVQVNVPRSFANAKARYTVTHAAGHTTKVVDQAAVGGWVSLGTYEDRAGRPLSVHLGDNGSTATKTYLSVDAVRFQSLGSPPGAPSGVSASAGNGRATVRWSAAAPNGAAVDGYTVTASPGGRQVLLPGAARSATVTGLANWRAYSFTVRAHNAVGAGAASSASKAVTPTDRGHLTAVDPVRILDTRRGTTANARATALAPRASLTLRVAGAAGSPVPGSATAAALNVTVTRPAAAGSVYVGDAASGAGTVSFARGQSIAHGMTTRLRPDGTVTVTNHSPGTVHVLADVHAYSRPVGVGNVHAVTDTLVLDTRQGAASNSRRTALGAGSTMRVRVAGVTGSPVPRGARAVALNVTATRPGARGFLYVADRASGLSTLNFRPGETLANFVVSKVAADGTVTIANRSRAAVHVLASVQGYLSAADSGPGLVPITTTRIADARAGTPANPALTTLPAHSRTLLHVAGAAGTRVPASAQAAALDVTVFRPARGGWLYAGSASDGPSVLSFAAGTTVSNHVIARLTPAGDVVVVNHAGSPVQVRVDATGYTR